MAVLTCGHPMSGIYRIFWIGEIRLRPLRNLIFFVLWLLASCQPPEETGIAIRWEGQRAIALAIPERLLETRSADSLTQLLAVRLTGEKTAILGSYRNVDNAILFQPLVPFTRGLRYTVWQNHKPLGELTIPALAANDRPKLLAIYPSQDSLPENLLKIYLHFSRPMREGQSRTYVALLKNSTDTLPGVFLDLQPELWNADRTLLTLWLDPGRIKRDLQPNKRLGALLQTGVRYSLVVSSAWPDTQGAVLGQSVTKSFVAIPRDSLSPDVARWSVYAPQSGGLKPITVDFGEGLDYSLSTETMRVIDPSGAVMPGRWQVDDSDKQVYFKPANVWQPGQYQLRIEGRLEDLAGNNLNRLFDRDITRKETTKTPHSFHTVSFTIR